MGPGPGQYRSQEAKGQYDIHGSGVRSEFRDLMIVLFTVQRHFGQTMNSEAELQSAAAAFKASRLGLGFYTVPTGHNHVSVAGCSSSSDPVTGSGHLAVNIIGGQSDLLDSSTDQSIEALPSHAGWSKQARNDPRHR